MDYLNMQSFGRARFGAVAAELRSGPGIDRPTLAGAD